jgi:hypothetical protein
MLKSKVFIIILAALFMMIWTGCFAQNQISSPYSRYGVGVLNNTTNSTLSSMGGVSYAMQSRDYINFRNPASYVAFDSLTFVGDIAFNVQTTYLKTTALNQKGTIGRIGYITIGLPITKHWRTSVGFIPFSDRGYNITDSRNLEDIGIVNYNYVGEGGLMQLYWGNAFKLCKGLSFGLNVSYLFGTLSSIRYEEFEGDFYYNYRIAQSDLVDGIYLQAGLQYKVNIGEFHKLGLGAVYENSAYVWMKRNLLVNRYTNQYSSVNTYDTAYSVLNQKGSMRIPQSVGGGLSYSYKDKLLVGVDVTWQNWQNYSIKLKNSSVVSSVDSLKNAIIVQAGLQFIPDPNSGKFGKNIALRVGAHYSTGYIQIDNTPISEFSVRAGIGLPFRTYNTRCSLNLMLEYGRTGSLRNDLIRQDYFKIELNLILVERWYQRVKLE